MLRILLTVVLVPTILAGCQVSEYPASYDVGTVALPQGYSHTGREVFLEKGCTSCHRVAWETDLPEPTAFVTGPVFDQRHSRMSAGYLATSIAAPSYHVSQPYRETVSGGFSPMADYSAAITVRELVDVVAYLRGQGGDSFTPFPAVLEREMLPHNL